MKAKDFTFESATDFIMSALPMYQRVGKVALNKFDLSKTLDFLDYLGNPHHSLQCIHIAGTNGKGSVSHMLAAIFQENKYRTGLFTSPHLKDYRERIKINGEWINSEFLTQWVNEHYPYLKEAGLSFFEMSSGLAFSYFAAQNIDIAVIEVGLGGRLDSTNVIHPILSIITNIDYDHMDILGDTLEAIAREKGGIIKPQTPVVLGNVDQSLYPIFETIATRNNAQLYFSDQLRCKFLKIKDYYRYYDRLDRFGKKIGEISIDNIGPYQDMNLNTVLHAIDTLQRCSDVNLKEEAVVKGLSHFTQLTRFQGRFEIIQQNPLVIADAAHNTAGIQFLKSYFDKKSLHLHIVLAMVNGKDHHSVLKLLPKDARYYFCNISVPRGMKATELKQVAESYQLTGQTYESGRIALDEILKSATSEEVVLVFGSIFLIAEIL